MWGRAGLAEDVPHQAAGAGAGGGAAHRHVGQDALDLGGRAGVDHLRVGRVGPGLRNQVGAVGVASARGPGAAVTSRPPLAYPQKARASWIGVTMISYPWLTDSVL